MGEFRKYLEEAWLRGDRILAGGVLLTPGPVHRTTYGIPCPEEGCHSIMCGVTEELASARLLEHKRTEHPYGVPKRRPPRKKKGTAPKG